MRDASEKGKKLAIQSFSVPFDYSLLFFTPFLYLLFCPVFYLGAHQINEGQGYVAVSACVVLLSLPEEQAYTFYAQK